MLLKHIKEMLPIPHWEKIKKETNPKLNQQKNQSNVKGLRQWDHMVT